MPDIGDIGARTLSPLPVFRLDTLWGRESGEHFLSAAEKLSHFRLSANGLGKPVIYILTIDLKDPPFSGDTFALKLSAINLDNVTTTRMKRDGLFLLIMFVSDGVIIHSRFRTLLCGITTSS